MICHADVLLCSVYIAVTMHTMVAWGYGEYYVVILAKVAVPAVRNLASKDNSSHSLLRSYLLQTRGWRELR